MLRRGGVCWLVANRHLPYEAVLASAFETATVREDAGGYKVIEAVK
jgi:16S rRNA (guanine1207-N2)-methyltransferase